MRVLRTPPAFDPDRLGGPLRVAIVVGQSDSFGSYASQLARAMTAIGVDASVFGSCDPLPDGDAAILVGLHRFERHFVDALHHDRVVIAMQTEQLTTGLQGAPHYGDLRRAAVLALLQHVDGVVEWSAENAAFLRTMHPRVAVAPYGFLEADLHAEVLSVDPLHDLAFVGHIHALAGRRRRILAELRADFDVHPTFEGAWGKEKLRVFAQSRIVLNLHVESSAVFESPRFFDALGARRPLVSEPVHDPWPFRAGRDFVEASVLDLRDVLKALLEDEQRREDLARSGRSTAEAHGIEQIAATLLRLILISFRP